MNKIWGYALTADGFEEKKRRKKIQEKVKGSVKLKETDYQRFKTTCKGTTSKHLTDEELVFGVDPAPFGANILFYDGTNFEIELMED